MCFVQEFKIAHTDLHSFYPLNSNNLGVRKWLPKVTPGAFIAEVVWSGFPHSHPNIPLLNAAPTNILCFCLIPLFSHLRTCPMYCVFRPFWYDFVLFLLLILLLAFLIQLNGHSVCGCPEYLFFSLFSMSPPLYYT